jgi:hypothetical protein
VIQALLDGSQPHALAHPRLLTDERTVGRPSRRRATWRPCRVRATALGSRSPCPARC